MTTDTLRRLRALYEQHQSEQALAAEEAERERQAKGRLEFQRRVERFLGIVPAEALGDDWRIISPQSDECLRLRSTFLGDDPLCLSVRFDEHWRDSSWLVRAVDEAFGYHGAEREFHATFERRLHTPDEAARKIAGIVVPALECRADVRARWQRERAEREAQEQRWRQQREAEDRAQAAREARAEQAKDTAENLLASLKAELEQLSTEVAERFGWPEGRVLHVFRLGWLNGVSSDGEYQDWGSAWSPDPQPEPTSDFWRTLTGSGIGFMAIRTPNALTVEEVVWRSAADLPYPLGQTLQPSVQVEVVYHKRSYYDHVTAEVQLPRLILPGLAVRELLELPTDPIPPLMRSVRVPLDDQVTLDEEDGDDQFPD